MTEGNSMSILWWIIGVAVAAFAVAKLVKRGGVSSRKAEEVFKRNRKRFDALINDLGTGKFDKQAWSEEIVDLNDKELIKYWMYLCKTKRDEDLKMSWYNTLSNEWNIYIPKNRNIGKSVECSAKHAFLERVSDFVAILDTLTGTSFNSTESLKLWTDAIVNVNNKNLTDLWTRMVEKFGTNVFDKWKRQLEAWGVKSDTCKNFTYTQGRIFGYTLQNGNPFEEGKKYSVITPCWVLTVDLPDGGVKKTIIKTGVVESL